ncbi:MAG: hypothetical protein KAX05_11375 [Bacteroidales bacterium]|nr:hypothetical protein [Bacteroidales bacterium]
MISFSYPLNGNCNKECLIIIWKDIDSSKYPLEGSESVESPLPVYSFHKIPYDLANPDTKYILPDFLQEISGMSYYDKDKIACIQDEKAIIYILTLEKKKITSKYYFGKGGDYEGIAIAGKTAFALKNCGEIYEIENFNKKDRKVKKYKTPLSLKNDTEGLCFDPGTNSLLIVCKGSQSIEKENAFEGHRSIYSFDLEEKKLNKKPHYLIDLKKIDNYKDYSLFTKFSIKIAKKLRLIENEIIFQPSGIAIHPIHDEIYIISNIGKLLIVLDRSGKVLDVKDLDSKLFIQPEGICFSPGGDLFISNEGQGGKGYILRFKYQRH